MPESDASENEMAISESCMPCSNKRLREYALILIIVAFEVMV